MGTSSSISETASTQSFLVEASGFSMRVTADCPATLAYIERHLLPCLPHTSYPLSPPSEIDLVLRRVSPADHFEVELNGVTIAAREKIPYLFTLIQQIADETMIRHLGARTAIHAGTVVYRNKAIAISGPSRSGKSSLVQELLLQGAEYCSDEYAILDSQGQVHPYPRALMIRRDDGEQYPVLASEIHATVREQPAPATLFLFLSFQPDAGQLVLQPLDRSEFLIRLLRNTPQVMADQPQVLEPLKAAISGARSFHGVRGEVARAASEILQLAAEAS